jgi:hypothetical protein
MKNVFLVIILFFNFILVHSQGYSALVGYSNIGTNYGYAGLDYRATKETHLNIGAGILATFKNGKIEALPQLHFNCTPFGNGKSDFEYLFMTEIATTTESLHPSIGIQLLNVLKIKTGYNMPYLSNQSVTGITFGITLALISKKSFYQDNLKIM